MRPASLVLPLFLAACASTDHAEKPAAKTATKTSGAATGVEDQALADLLSRQWEHMMTTSPIWATRLGDHRFDDRVSDVSAEAIAADEKATRAFLEEAKAMDAQALNRADRTTLLLFTAMLQHSVDAEVCRFDEWTLSPRSNPVTQWNDLPDAHPIETDEDAKNYLKRVQLAAAQIENTTKNLERGAKDGVFANAESVRRVQKMVADQLAQPIDEWPLLKPGKKHPAIAADLKKAVEEGIRPAVERYAQVLEKSIAPNARGPDKTGLGALPFGKACYEARIRNFTGLPLEAAQIHETGKQEIARINAEMSKLGEKLFGTAELPKILERLRSDKSLHFESAEEIETKAKSALAKAKAAIPKYFGVLPKAECVVTRIPDYEAPYTTIAYYQQPVPDGSKPGQYYVNVYQPKTRPTYEFEALSYHESIPGHHLQIAIAQERPAMPSFRKHLGQTAFVEGWALYSEQLADEMGLYSGDLDRMGMLSYEAWRASRLVVDTGLHAMGWSRDQAKKYMAEHTALAANNIDNEVDRYIVWPGQALGYKTGQMEIWRLRRDAEKKLGDGFDIRGFHDAVLSGGAVSLPVLREQIDEWVEAQLKRR